MFLILFNPYPGLAQEISPNTIAILNSNKHDTIKLQELSDVFDNTGDEKIKLNISRSYLKIVRKLISSSNKAERRAGIIHCGYALYNQAKILEGLAQMSKAVDYYLKGIELYEKVGFFQGISDHYNSIAMIFSRTSQYEKALDYYFKALEIDLKRNNNEDIAYLYNNIGNVYNLLNEEEKAKEYFLKGLQIIQNTKPDNIHFLLYSNLGSLGVQNNVKDSSLFYCYRGLDVALKLGLKKEISVIYNNISKNYFNEGKMDSAKLYMDLAIEAAKNGDEFHALSQLYKNKATYLLKTKQFREAEELGLMSYALAKKFNLGENLRTSSNFLRQYYSELKNYQKASYYNDIYMRINDSLFSENIRKMALTKQIAFDFQLKENKMIADQEKKDILANQYKMQQVIIRNVLVIAFILLMFIAIYIYGNYRNKKRINELITEQKGKLELQHIALTEKQKEILDSIEYAKRLQRAILAPQQELHSIFSEALIIYHPKSIVSGDFYWFAESTINKIVAVADCTGHGVPGGFMSMLGYEILQDVLLKEQITTTSMALKILDRKMTDALSKSGAAYRDGMDIALCAFSKHNNMLQFSGANRPLIKISEGILTEIKPNKFTIGGDIDGINKTYLNHEVPFAQGDIFYLFSDGYADQFGGASNKKFSYRKFKDLLQSICHKPLDEQKDILTQTFEAWKSHYEQIDDVCIIGIKI